MGSKFIFVQKRRGKNPHNPRSPFLLRQNCLLQIEPSFCVLILKYTKKQTRIEKKMCIGRSLFWVCRQTKQVADPTVPNFYTQRCGNEIQDHSVLFRRFGGGFHSEFLILFWMIKIYQIEAISRT